MRRAFAMATSLCVACGPAAAATPVDAFEQAVTACASTDRTAILMTMSRLGGVPYEQIDLDRVVMSQAIGLAYAYMHGTQTQAEIDAQPTPVVDAKGWTVGDVKVLLMMQVGGTQSERVCSVFSDADKFDAAVSLISGALGHGQPARSFSFGGHRVAGWDLNTAGPIPGIMAMNATTADGRKPTSVQIISK